MISDTERKAFLARVEALRLRPEALESVRIHIPGGFQHNIPNVDGKINSLQIWAHATSNDGYVGVESAKKALDIYGEPLRRDARIAKLRGAAGERHPAIEHLETLVERGEPWRVDVIRRNPSKPVPPRVQRAIEETLKRGCPTPFIIYDSQPILENARELNDAFSWVPGGFKNYFAVKACPNPTILELLKNHAGMGADCSSKPELNLSNSVGIRGENIMFTSNDTSIDEFKRARELGAIINLDDLEHIDCLESSAGIPELVFLRYNPGSRRVGNSIIGNPVESKYGFTHEQIFEGLTRLKAKGVKRVGLHTMVASNELNPEYFVETGRMMFSLKREVEKKLGIPIESLNLGGGLGTPYKHEQRKLDPKEVSRGIQEAYQSMVIGEGLTPANIFMENGRFITGPYGYLVAKVRHVTHKYKDFVGLDACMSNLMRPGMYGAFHHISVLGKEGDVQDQVYDVTGSLCENNDKFAVNRPLPLITRGDVVVIHNVGAHGYAMGFQYNGKLRCAEFLIDESEKIRMIRRAETEDDYFATFDYPGSRFASLARN
ncbi:MAG: diaminopimelate decarboxylase [Nanoarchaeota archaeon]